MITNLLFDNCTNLKVSPVFGSVALSFPTTTEVEDVEYLSSATLPPLAHAIFVGASFVSVAFKVIVAGIEFAVPSFTLKVKVV